MMTKTEQIRVQHSIWTTTQLSLLRSLAQHNTLDLCTMGHHVQSTTQISTWQLPQLAQTLSFTHNGNICTCAAHPCGYSS
eukprot:4850536-Pyramimonas_sp.AAC.1